MRIKVKNRIAKNFSTTLRFKSILKITFKMTKKKVHYQVFL